MPEASVEAHCDMVYTLYMLGSLELIAPAAVEQFSTFLRAKNLPGWEPEGDERPILVHNCAYAFGALNLLSANPAALYNAVLGGRQSDLDAIVHPKTKVPVFPPKWAHHNWRVSHWIGGIPSMLLSVARSGWTEADRYEALFHEVRYATDRLLAQDTGLIKAYKSDAVQYLFRRLYSLRHDPDLGDLGGVAHILWVDHAIGRRYVGLDQILKRSQLLFHTHPLFMEKVPYCLDFDIVQVVRTAREQAGQKPDLDVVRARKMMTDIERFFQSGVPETYTLHKVPGALATYHECAMLSESDTKVEISIAPIDIIKKAHWL